MNNYKTFRYLIALIVLFAAANAGASLPVALLLIYMIVWML